MKQFNLKIMPQQCKMIVQTGIFVLTAMLALFYGCSHSEKVLVPPHFDLKPYNKIGVIEFSSKADDSLTQQATQNFIQAVQSAQPGTRFLELGNEEQVLRSVACSKLDFEAIRLIGGKFGIDALLIGLLEISEVRPRVQVSSNLTSVRAEAHVEASLSSKLLETGSGATLWTQATSGKKSVAKLSLVDDGHIRFGMSDPQEKYGKLVSELVYENTTDFRPYYEYRKVSK